MPERKIDPGRVLFGIVLLPSGPEISFRRRLSHSREAQAHD